MYEDGTTDVEGGLEGNTEYDEDPSIATGLDREVPTPEANENYVNTLVMLPRVNIYSRRKFIGQKRDAYGNSVGRLNYNPILDTREYSV